jgi:hypothetical protein
MGKNETMRKNEKCFLGMPACGYGYESARSCFVACPDDDKYKITIALIEQIILSKQYECHIALKKIDPGNFAFCTKICSKIIQSQFCVVFLDPSINEKKEEHPNPNVHLEYGMMMGQNKHIIPLQDEKHDLPFNISPIDTIKYNSSNFESKVTEAIDDAIKKFDVRNEPGQLSPGPEIFIFYNMKGYVLSDISSNTAKSMYDMGVFLGFFLFDDKYKYKYIGPFDNEDPKIIILHTKVLINNITSVYNKIVSAVTDPNEKSRYDRIIKEVSIDIIVPPFYEKEDIKDKIEKIANNEHTIPVNIYYRADFKNKVEDEYNQIGEIPVKDQKTIE